LGHARTFRIAWQRARENSGTLYLRIENADTPRCKPEFLQETLEELTWLGLDWDGDVVYQSERLDRYLDAWRQLLDGGWIYPCNRSRKDMRELVTLNDGDEQDTEPLIPPEWRPAPGVEEEYASPDGVTWRFRVPDGEVISFQDAHHGKVTYQAGTDFGDFSVWRRDGIPAYELSVVVDDIAMGITEVVRGADLLRSTARQILLYRALGAQPPAWCHEPLVRDGSGRRLSKRDHDRSLRSFREEGKTAEEVLRGHLGHDFSSL
jgi:glutamyl-tRNA synthetase